MAALLSESSPTPDDQTVTLSNWLAELREEDRDFVLALAKGACAFLRRRR